MKLDPQFLGLLVIADRPNARRFHQAHPHHPAAPQTPNLIINNTPPPPADEQGAFTERLHPFLETVQIESRVTVRPKSVGIIHDADECRVETIVQLHGGHIVRVPCALDEVLALFG